MTRGTRVLTGIIDYIKAYYRVCRLEYAPGEIPAILTVLFLGAASFSRFFEPIVLEALLVFLLLYLSGFIINAITDKELDIKYDTFKTSIPKSVELLGERTLWAMIIAHVGIAIVLATHISLVMNSILPISLVLIGTFFGLGYSIRPFHFKVRGIWHAIALGSSAFFIPFVFLMFVVAEGISFPLWIFIAGFSFIHYGMEFGNQAIDYVEDKASKVRTPPVRWGMIPSLTIALCCVICGIMVEISSLYFILLTRGSFTFIHPILTTNVVYLVLVAIILAGYYIPTKGLWQMHSALIHSKSIESSMPTLKRICNYAKWQASGILGVATISAILFLGVILAPTTLNPDSGNGADIIESDLKIASTPEVEFYEDDGVCYAIVNISVLNDDTLKERGSLRIEVQSWVVNRQKYGELLFLEEDLIPNEYWNIKTQILAHDVDDTTIKIQIEAYDSNLKVFYPVGDPWIVPSQKDLYIYEVDIEYYEDIFFDKKANLTVTVFNEEYTKDIGDLEVQVYCYSSIGYTDSGEVANNRTLHPNQYWEPVVRDLNVLELEVDDPIFHVKLIEFDANDNGELIDDIWIVT